MSSSDESKRARLGWWQLVAPWYGLELMVGLIGWFFAVLAYEAQDVFLRIFFWAPAVLLILVAIGMAAFTTRQGLKADPGSSLEHMTPTLMMIVSVLSILAGLGWGIEVAATEAGTGRPNRWDWFATGGGVLWLYVMVLVVKNRAYYFR